MIRSGDGAHGRGMHTGDPDTGIWPQLARNWLRRNAFFTPLSRVEITGTLTIDDAAPFMAWVTLVPVDNPNLPSASIYYNDSDEKKPLNGHFRIEARYGPVPGRYRVEVRHVSRGLLDEPTLEGERLYTSLSPEQPGPILVEIKPGQNELPLPLKTH